MFLSASSEVGEFGFHSLGLTAKADVFFNAWKTIPEPFGMPCFQVSFLIVSGRVSGYHQFCWKVFWINDF